MKEINRSPLNAAHDSFDRTHGTAAGNPSSDPWWMPMPTPGEEMSWGHIKTILAHSLRFPL